jgi:hypothetical protein
MPSVALTFALALMAMPIKPCHDAKGHVVACPKTSPVAEHCHDAKGREIKCGLPGARPAGLKTEKPHQG